MTKAHVFVTAAEEHLCNPPASFHTTFQLNEDADSHRFTASHDSVQVFCVKHRWES